MANNGEVPKPDAGVPSADIPDLKKKDKERKRGGLTWGGGRGAGSTFNGATGAARSAASAASSAAGSVAAGAQAGAGLAAKFAALSLMGKLAAAAGAVVVLGGAGMMGVSLLGGAGTGGVASTGGPSLGGISSSIKIHSGGNDRIGVDSRGEIAFDPVKKAKPAEKKAEEAQPADAAPPATAPGPDMAQQMSAAKDKLEHNLSGAKLSSSLGGTFGGKNIFAGSGGSAPKFGDSAPKFAPKGGKLSALRPGSARATASSHNISQRHSSRALGQLRIARGLSVHGASASSADEASNAASNAFEQNDGQPGALSASGDTAGTVASLGSGAGGLSSQESGDITDPGTNAMDAIQSQIDQIRSLIDQAVSLTKSGWMLIALGITLMVVAYVLMDIPWTSAAGLIILAISLGMIFSGYGKLSAADKLKEQAKEMGKKLASQTGDFQSKVVQECVDQAIANLTSIDQCRSLEAEERKKQVEEQKQRDLERQKEISTADPQE